VKVLILGDASNPHIIKWANGLQSADIRVVLFSLVDYDKKSFKEDIEVYNSKGFVRVSRLKEGAITKTKYLTTVPQIRSIIKKTKPDILHSHYASSYGILGALTGFHPFIVSVWGGDVISFPKYSPFHKALLKFTLKKADRILSTSNFMAKLLLEYTNKSVEITPFGVDTTVFKPDEKLSLFSNHTDLVIGTIKSLEWYYGIEYLVQAFHIVTKQLPDLKLKLLVVGGGALEKKIKNLVHELNLDDRTLFTGKISYNEIYKYYNALDIYVAVSVYEESFGVAVLEASATEKPVIISRVGGMIEVIDENVTGFVVPPRNAEETAQKLIELIMNEDLRHKMGKAGRKLVVEKFSFDKCLNDMMNIYENILNQL